MTQQLCNRLVSVVTRDCNSEEERKKAVEEMTHHFNSATKLREALIAALSACIQDKQDRMLDLLYSQNQAVEPRVRALAGEIKAYFALAELLRDRSKHLSYSALLSNVMSKWEENE